MMIAGWQILEAATVRRKRLLQAGYLPIPAAGKKPPIAGWTDVVATESIIDGWFHSHPEALNTGILTRTTPAVDVDVYDAEVAQEIEELLWETVGSRGMVRFGQPPKRAILFRTDTPFGKISTPVFTSPTKLQHRVEILCNGQQIIVLGTHPDTGKPYSWYGGEFGDVARADLPDLTEALACEFITKAAAIMRARGWIEEIVRKPNGQNGAHHVVVAGDGDEFDSMYGGREQNYALATLQGCCDELGAMAPNSGRNNKLNALAYRLGTMSGRHWISGDEVSRQLFDAAAKCALVAEDGAASVRATIKSGLKKGEQSPHPDLANDTIDVKAAVVEPPRPDGFPFEYAKDFGEAVAPRWIIKNHIARGEISSWIGPPGSAKSAMLGDISIHVVAGLDWRGNRLKENCGVLYFALERHDLVKRRFKVQAGKLGLFPEDLPFAVVKEVVNTMHPICVEQIVATIKSVEAGWTDYTVGMIVIDTSAKAIAAGCGDENSAKDTNIAHANLRRIQVLRDVHIALVGHTGKDETRGQRGSNAPRGDVDKENTLRDGQVFRTKNNDGPEGHLFGYRVEAVVVGIDEDGEEISTAIVAADDPGVKANHRRANLSKSQYRAMELLDRALLDEGQPPPMSSEMPHGIGKVVTREVWCTYCVKGGLSGGAPASSERAFRRAMIDLLNLHFIGTWQELVWIAYD